MSYSVSRCCLFSYSHLNVLFLLFVWLVFAVCFQKLPILRGFVKLIAFSYLPAFFLFIYLHTITSNAPAAGVIKIFVVCLSLCSFTLSQITAKSTATVKQ